jgi:hypothetical protein
MGKKATTAEQGRIYFWRYQETRKGWEGWHMTADAAGCGSLVAAIDQLLAADAGSSRPFPILAPTPAILAVPNNRRVPAVAPKRFSIIFRNGEEQSRYWEIHESEGTLVLSLGAARLHELRTAIEDVAKGGGDYAVGADGKRRPSDQCLWFWWLTD